MRGFSNDVYFQIGLVVLIGLAAKNAILIVEFAAQEQAKGLAPFEAALEAARLRFRPIVMTSLAFVLGVLPLVLAGGAGAGARRSMGTGVFGGMLAATFIATLFIPLFFVILSRTRAAPGAEHRRSARKRRHDGAALGAGAARRAAGRLHGRPRLRAPRHAAAGGLSGRARPKRASSGRTVRAIRADWWTLYDDPMLNDLVASALADNLDVAFAVARIEEADANLREANAALFPEIDLAALGATVPLQRLGDHAGRRFASRNDLRVALSTSFEIDFWGRLRRMVESARAQALATHYARDVVTLSLAGLTTQTYFALRSLDAQIAPTRETLTTRDDNLDIVRRRADSGLASDLDLNQALGARADAAAQLKELRPPAGARGTPAGHA